MSSRNLRFKPIITTFSIGLFICLFSIGGILHLKGYSFKDFNKNLFDKFDENKISIYAKIDCPYNFNADLKIITNMDNSIGINFYLLHTDKKNLYKECKEITLFLHSESGNVILRPIINKSIFNEAKYNSIHEYKQLKSIEMTKNDFAKINKQDNNYEINIDKDKFEGEIVLNIENFNNEINFYRKKLKIFMNFEDTNINKLSTSLLLQKNQELAKSMPNNVDFHTVGALDIYDLDMKKSEISYGKNYLEFIYDVGEKKELYEILIIIFSTLIGIGATGMFQIIYKISED